MFRSLSIYEGEKGDPYDLIIPLRRVEYTTRVTSGGGGDSGGPVRSGGGDSGGDGTTPSSGGESGGTRTASGESDTPTDTGGTRPTDDAAGTPRTEGDAGAAPKPGEGGTRGGLHDEGGAAPKTEAEVNAQRTTEEQAADTKSKNDILSKIGKGLMLLPALLPLALLTAGFIQGLASCVEINGRNTAPKKGPKEFKITNAVSAAWPSKDFTIMNGTKVDLTYSDCYKILKSDKIHIKSSNVFDGDFDPVSTNGECKVRIDIGKKYTSNIANTSMFTLTTDCAARMAYAVGDDASTLLQTAGTGIGDVFSGLTGNVPWSGIFLFFGVILAIWLAFKAISIFRSS